MKEGYCYLQQIEDDKTNNLMRNTISKARIKSI